MNTVFIYALNCPITGRTRYVGKANNPQRRFTEHLIDKSFTHRTCWIRSLVTAGQKPILEILDEVPSEFWPQWEVAYIQFFRDEGFDLVNGNAGGEGGADPTPETRAKLSVSNLGNRKSVGVIRSEETRAKIGVANLGNRKAFGAVRSEETRAKISAGLRGHKRSEETRARMCIAQKAAAAIRKNKQIV